MNKRAIKTVSCVVIALFVILLFVLTIKLPAQKLKITAQTTEKEFDLSDSVKIYYFGQTKSNSKYTATIKFMAVSNTSKKLFTHFGTGQYVYLGCKELQVDYDFISFGRFLEVDLTLKAAQTDLKLEDGTPFDMTKYSLKPVLSIEE